MKSEATAHATAAALRGGASQDPKTQRWLADLERALLDATPKRGDAGSEPEAPVVRNEAGARSAAGPQATDPAPATGRSAPAAVLEARAKVVSTAPSRGPLRAGAETVVGAGNADPARAQEEQEDAALPPLQPQAPSDTGGSPQWTRAAIDYAAADGPTPVSAAALATWVIAARDGQTAGAMVRASARASTEPISRLPAARALDAGRLGRVHDAACEEAAPLADAPTSDARADYAKRLLQVSGDEDLQLNLRDAALQPAQHTSVAVALFEQLHQAGMPLRRVYINGERFEHDAPSTLPLPPIQIPSLDQE